jgi:hypothetical protein
LYFSRFPKDRQVFDRQLPLERTIADLPSALALFGVAVLGDLKRATPFVSSSFTARDYTTNSECLCVQSDRCSDPAHRKSFLNRD